MTTDSSQSPLNEVIDKYIALGEKYRPVKASFEITARCNASCRYCYVQTETPLASATDLSTKQIRFIIDKLYDSGVFGLCITGGEPFLRSDIGEILMHVFAREFFYFSILTNGTMISDWQLDLLAANAPMIRSIQMSVFCHDPAVHDAYTGVPGGLKMILKNGEFLQKAGIPVTLGLNALAFNVGTVRETLDYFTARGFIIVPSVEKAVIDIDKQDLATSLEPQFYEEYFRQIQSPVRESYMRDLEQSLCTTPLENKGLCLGRFVEVNIDAQGDIHPCLGFRTLNMGSMFDSRDLRTILMASDEYHKIRELTLADIPSCGSCSKASFCSFCPGLVYTQRGLTHKPDQACNFAAAVQKALLEQPPSAASNATP